MLSKFFKPDDDMTKFVMSLANGKTIIDVGTGTGHFLDKLRMNGYSNYIGVEPHTPHEYMSRKVIHRILPHDINSHHMQSMIEKIADKSIVTLCRPCHHPELIISTYLLCERLKLDMYYIGLKKNLRQDLDFYNIKYEAIPHEGSSDENEIILKLNFN